MKKEELKKLKIADRPGVYIFRKGKNICYVGKATSLRNRVRSYFGKDLIATRGPLLVDMVFQADKVECRSTESVLEALILEAELIRKYKPWYNTKEKDDKSFNYVGITKERTPRVITVRGKELKEQENFSRLTLPRVRGGTYATRNFLVPFVRIFGPFPHGPQLREAMKIIRRIFPYLDNQSKQGYKFYEQIGLAPDVSTKEGVELYKKNIKNLKLFFEGKKKRILKNLEKDMKKYAKAREFEKAGEMKRQIFALKHINDVALLQGESSLPGRPLLGEGGVRIESYDIAHMSGRNMVGVMTVVENGEAQKSEYRKFSARGGSAFGGKTVL